MLTLVCFHAVKSSNLISKMVDSQKKLGKSDPPVHVAICLCV